jgi:hypothetical protein
MMNTKEALSYLLDHPTAVLESFTNDGTTLVPRYAMNVVNGTHLCVQIGREVCECGRWTTYWFISNLPIDARWFVVVQR